MKETQELIFFKDLFNKAGKKKIEKLLNESNLTTRETDLLKYRFIEGMTLKECAQLLVIEENSVNRAQLRAIKKLYYYLNAN